MASIGESVMRVSFTKKYIKIRALEIDAESEKAEVERMLTKTGILLRRAKGNKSRRFGRGKDADRKG